MEKKNTREKVHIVTAREIFTSLCVEMAVCLKILNIDSERETSASFLFNHIYFLATFRFAGGLVHF